MYRDGMVVNRLPNRYGISAYKNHPIILKDDSRWFLCDCGVVKYRIWKYTNKRKLNSYKKFEPHHERKGWWT